LLNDLIGVSLNNRPNESQLKVENLQPGRTYRCIGKMEYFEFNTSKNFVESKTPVIDRTTSLTFDIKRNAFGFEMKIDENININWPLIVYFKRNLNHEAFNSSKMETNKLQLFNLDMFTEYKICLALIGDKCPSNENECQECKVEKTLEDYPFSPSDVKITKIDQKNIRVTWNPPRKPSGNIINYIVELEGNCIEEDKRCNQECKSSQEKIVSGVAGVAGVSRFSVILEENVKPFWSYTARVKSENSVGAGNSSEDQFNSDPKPELPQEVTIAPKSKSLTINILPECPYTGPAHYTIVLTDKNDQVKDKKILEYMIQEGTVYLKNVTFQDLMPAKQYRVCISLPSSETKCYSNQTEQIPPEGYPKMVHVKTHENSITFQMNRPENAHGFENENLTYNFERVDKCSYAENTTKCSSNCLEESAPFLYTFQSPNQRFYYNFTNLEPKWNYKFRAQV
jgi:hypothetical protein